MTTFISLAEDCKAICREFANASDVSLYVKRTKITEQKAREDCYVGKMAEFAVYAHMRNNGFVCTEPDVKIYSAKQKSWKADLTANGEKLHVKCQTVAKSKKYGRSWIFEATDSGVFKRREGIAAFCISHPDESIEIVKTCPIEYLLSNNLFKETKLKFRNKLAVYEKDLV